MNNEPLTMDNARAEEQAAPAAHVPPGYQQTEVGVIPVEWEVRHLGDDDLVYRVGSGITPTGGQRVYKQTGHPFIRSQNIGWGQLLLRACLGIT
jgi:type I restriction enzyme S subunit